MFKNINKKLSLIILASVFIGIVIAVVANQGASATSDDSFCLSCHDVPEFKENFEATPHAQVGCINCHGDGFIKDKVKGASKAFSTITGQLDPNDYSAIKAEVPNDRCLSCHNIDNISRDQGVVTMHEGFVTGESDTACTSCHNVQFFHGDLVGSTKSSDEATDEGDAVAEVVEVTADVLYSDSCANCHGDDLQGAVYAEPISGMPYANLLDKLEDGHGGINEAEHAELLSEWISNYAGDATEEDGGAVSVDPEGLYSDSCANCHGDDLQGAVYAEPISGMPYADLLDKLEDGHGGIDDTESAESLSQWISEQ